MEIDLNSSVPLLGCIAKLTEFGVELEKEYEKTFGIGSYNRAFRIWYYCHLEGRYQMSLMFIDQQPYVKNGVKFYCLKEVGVGVMGDWHWFSLNQLIVCNEK